MIIKQVGWIRQNTVKMCPILRKTALECYKPIKHLPCFMQKPFLYIRHRFKKVPVIVQLDKAENIRLSGQIIAASYGFQVARELDIIGAFSTRVNVKKLEQLLADNRIKKIWYDREVRAVLDVASPAVQAPPLWNDGITGKGITVAVVDTGIYRHPDLAGRIVGFKDFIKQKTEAYDDNGHGTHVAGDIGASGVASNNLYKGPAPECRLVGVKVLDKMGSGSLSTVIAGIQWCVENKDVLGIKVINLSLGSEAAEPYTDDPVCRAVETAWQAGITVCAAAGNSGPKPVSVNSPGISPVIITVGALDDINSIAPGTIKYRLFQQGAYRRRLGKTGCGRAGVSIVSLRSPNSLLDKQNKEARIDNWYTSLSGTSMATPVCCGAVAQILEYDNTLTPDQVKTLLMETATKLEGFDAYAQGSGVINAQKAVESAGRAALDPAASRG